jgi:hypothetical protein
MLKSPKHAIIPTNNNPDKNLDTAHTCTKKLEFIRRMRRIWRVGIIVEIIIFICRDYGMDAKSQPQLNYHRSFSFSTKYIYYYSSF